MDAGGKVMGLRKPFLRNGTWYCEIDRNRRSLKTSDASEAKKIFSEIKKQYLSGKLSQLRNECTTTLKEYREQYIEWGQHALEHSTYRANRLALDKIIEQAGESCRLDRITRKHLDDIVAQSRKARLSTASINAYIRHARVVMTKAVEWGIITANPLSGFKELPKEKRQPAYLDPGDAGKFLAKVQDVDLRRIVTAYLATGRRRSELFALTWADIDMDNSRYLVRKSKTHLSRWYPISAPFQAVLLSMEKAEGRIFHKWDHPDTVSHKVKAALKSCGYGHLRLHDLRHSFAVNFIQAGGGLRTLQELLGHTEYRTTEIYSHLTDDYLSEEIGRINLGPVALDK